MSESFALLHPRLLPEQAETILATSDAFGLWMRCKRAGCRRAQACRGFAGAVDIPACVPRLIGYTRVCLGAVDALLPERKLPPAPRAETVRLMGEFQLRAARLLDRHLQELERRAEAKAAPAGRAD
jgi:hypothetical protein